MEKRFILEYSWRKHWKKNSPMWNSSSHWLNISRSYHRIQAYFLDCMGNICGKTFCGRVEWRHRVDVQAACRVLRCVRTPLGRAAEWDAHHSVSLQMHLTNASLSASLGPDLIHTEECSLGLSTQPTCHADTHMHEYEGAFIETFGIISGTTFVERRFFCCCFLFQISVQKSKSCQKFN